MEDWNDEQDIHESYYEEDFSSEDAAQQSSVLARTASSPTRTGISVRDGFSAMRKVRHAAKQRSDAQADLREIARGLDEDRAALEHRESIELNYEEIVRVQTAALEQAQADADAAKAGLDENSSKQRLTQERLKDMRERHEQQLRPYRNLMESSRGRSDDAAKSLASARRAVKSAENAVNNATKRRDQRISSANRAVDNAQERLSAIHAELDQLGPGDETLSATQKLQAEQASEMRHLQSARSEVVQATQESQNAVDQAQQNLWALQRELTAAEKVAAEAKDKAMAHKDEYDALYKEAQAKEKTQEDAIKAFEARIKEHQKDFDTAIAKIRQAQAALDEANEIHDHPETTEGLRERIANEEEDLEAAQAELDELTESERQLRHETRGSRFALIGIAVFVVAVIIVLLWFLVIVPSQG